MALVLSFIHVVIVHINFHHPSYTSYYRAYHHRRPGLHRSRIPQSCLHARPIASSSVLFCVPLDKAVGLALCTHSGAQQLQTVCLCVKELTCSSEREPELWLTTAQTQGACTGQGKACHFRWHLTSPNCCRLSLIYQGLGEKKNTILEKQLDGQFPQKVLNPGPWKRFGRHRPSFYYTEGNIC